MKQLNKFKIKCFLEHLTLGTICCLVGLGFVVSILLEMITGFDGDSKIAYIFGMLCALAIAGVGVWCIVLAVNIHRLVLRDLKKNEKAQFLQEIRDTANVFENDEVIVTASYVITCKRKVASGVRIFRMEDLVACFSKVSYVSLDVPGRFELLICDDKFETTHIVAGGEDAQHMDEAYDMIVDSVPWVLNSEEDDMTEFMLNIKKRDYRKSCINKVRSRRGR